MNRFPYRRSLVLMLCVLLTGASRATAHHSILPYDGDHPKTIAGIVTRFEWENPHAHIYVDVRAGKGDVQHWVVESESPNLLRNFGWAKDSIKAGDEIRVLGAPARNGTLMMRCRVVYLPGGREAPCFPQD